MFVWIRCGISRTHHTNEYVGCFECVHPSNSEETNTQTRNIRTYQGVDADNDDRTGAEYGITQCKVINK